MAAINQPGSNQWKHDLFSCTDLGTCQCLFALCAPCIYAIPASGSVGEENRMWGYVTCLTTAFMGMALPFAIVRKNAREKNNIEGSLIGDAIAVTCCPCCSMLQVKGEFTD